MKLAINFIAFQLGWFSCVLAAAKGMPWLGPLVVLAVVLLHLKLVAKPFAELKLIGVAMALGLVTDSLLLSSGWLAYAGGSWISGLAPYWIIAMWALFATTLNVSMGWLRGRYLLAAIMGGIGGPLSYLAGEKLGAMTMSEPTLAIAALALAWSVAMPALMWLAARFE
jgi:hypothetical protein